MCIEEREIDFDVGGPEETKGRTHKSSDGMCS